MFKSMKRIIQWAGKYKGRLYLGSVFSFFSSLSTAIPTMAAAYALDKTIAAYWTGSTIESALIWQTLWIIVGSIALNFLLSYLRAVLQESIGYEVAAGQRIHLGDVLKRVPLGYFSKNSVGDILTGVNYQTLIMMLNDAPRYVRKKQGGGNGAPRPEHSAEDEANDIVGFFQSKLE